MALAAVIDLVGSLFGRRARNRRRAPRRDWGLPAIDWARWGSRALFAGAVLVLVTLLGSALDRPVRTVTVEGSFQRVRAGDVERVVRARLSGGFVTADLARLKSDVESLPWVDRARIQRRWPAGLVVEITEEVAAARWGEDGLLNARGELFLSGTRHVPAELPQLSGPAGTEWQVAQRFFAVQARLLEMGLRISALRLDARGAWEMDLSDGVTVRLGRRQVDERLQRFLDVAAPVVLPRADEVGYVDMRYSNGFSIGWRTREATPAMGGQADV